jgi:Holliday junction resolvasome RuvABC DNA-binding subunit
MRIVGSLTQAQVQRAYLDLGYSLHNATLLSNFVEKLASQTRKDKAQPYIDGLRRQILTMYVNEKLELSDAAFALNDLGFTPEEADHYFAEAKLIQQAEDALQVEAGIGRLYVSSFIAEDDARKRLGIAGAPAKAIDRLIRKWNLQRELHRDTEHFHKMRDLTKAEVTEAYTDKLMSREDADTFLEFLGYPKAEAEIVLSLADYKSARATRTAMQTAIQAAYVAGVRPLVETSNMLDKLGLPTDRRDALLQEWTLLRETRTEKIPTATLRDLVKTSRLTRADAFVHLKRHRYTDEDANIMLDLWLNVGP